MVNLPQQVLSRKVFLYPNTLTFLRVTEMEIGTLRSDNSDVHENVAEKQTSHHFKLLRLYPNSPCYVKERDFGWS